MCVPGPYLPLVCVCLRRGIWDTLAKIKLGEIENLLYTQIPIESRGFQTSVVARCIHLMLYNNNWNVTTCILLRDMGSIDNKPTSDAHYLPDKTSHILQIISFSPLCAKLFDSSLISVNGNDHVGARVYCRGTFLFHIFYRKTTINIH